MAIEPLCDPLFDEIPPNADVLDSPFTSGGNVFVHIDVDPISMARSGPVQHSPRAGQALNLYLGAVIEAHLDQIE